MCFQRIKSVITAPIFWFCLIVYSLVLLLGVWTSISQQTPTGCFNQLVLSENYGASIMIQTLIFPMITVSVFREERNSGYDWLMILRSGEKRYCISCVITVIAVTILAYVFSVTLFSFFCLVLSTGTLIGCVPEEILYLYPGEEGIWYQIATRVSYWLSYFLLICGYSMSVVNGALIGLCFSVFLKNKYVLFAAPFLFMRIWNYIGVSLVDLNYIPFYPQFKDGGLFHGIVLNGCIYLFFGWIYYLLIRWRRRHG